MTLSIPIVPTGFWRLAMNEFMNLFKFNPINTLHIGVEQECFLIDETGCMQPRVSSIIGKLPTRGLATPNPQYGYELSACQLEYKVGPCPLQTLPDHLDRTEAEMKQYELMLGFKRLHTEVGPEDMPIDVYPDPLGRYQEIAKTMPPEVLKAACRVIGTHIHVGMPNHEAALRAYNHSIKKYDWLCMQGNGSFGERLDMYRTVAPDCDPHQYESWSDFYRVACKKGFDKDPRKCWTLIRISKHGTIEFRMFGATSSSKRVVKWAKLCHDLCAEALR
jgi:gamma-glutamyl:cysteine ligase YbdK (ATP-grasp superfamily)